MKYEYETEDALPFIIHYSEFIIRLCCLAHLAEALLYALLRATSDASVRFAGVSGFQPGEVTGQRLEQLLL